VPIATARVQFAHFPGESLKPETRWAEGTEFELSEDFALGAQSFEPEGDFRQEPFFSFRFMSSNAFAKSFRKVETERNDNNLGGSSRK
jgi:hypothetical protein